MTLHTYILQAMSLQSFNFLHHMVSEIEPGQTFSPHQPIKKWVKTIPAQPLKAVGLKTAKLTEPEGFYSNFMTLRRP